MQAALAQKGTHVSLRTVYRTMSEAGLIHRHRRPHGITKADTETQNRENLIKRNFSADKPLKKLLTDITEVQCADGKLYVSPILDCFNGEIVALEMRDNMKKELCIDTVKQLREKYGRLDGTVLHSDRGCQYTSYAFRRELVTNGLIQSLSGTAHCYDNARMESFFATLKKEKLYQIPTYRMKREEVKTVIFRYIFGYYNTQRINSFNAGGLPPVALRTSTRVGSSRRLTPAYPRFWVFSDCTFLDNSIGVSCVPSLTSKQIPSLHHSHESGISNGISSEISRISLPICSQKA